MGDNAEKIYGQVSPEDVGSDPLEYRPRRRFWEYLSMLSIFQSKNAVGFDEGNDTLMVSK